MNLSEFLIRFVEGYLFHDLDNMSTLTVPQNQDDGAAGYPMISTTASGIELLGGLISTHPFSGYDGNEYFLDYWNRCLTVTNPQYEKLGELFRKLVRHGLVHTFLAKNGILITKRNPAIHPPTFMIDTSRNELIIDCVDFYNDFKRSYNEHIKPIVFRSQRSSLTTKDEMQRRLNEMVKIYEADSRVAFDDYFNRTGVQKTVNSTKSVNSSGASLPVGAASIATTGVAMTGYSTASITNIVNKKKP